MYRSIINPSTIDYNQTRTTEKLGKAAKAKKIRCAEEMTLAGNVGAVILQKPVSTGIDFRS